MTGDVELNYCYNCMTRMDPGQMVCPVCGHDNSVRRNTESCMPEGMILAGKYLIGRVLGQGGFGITYLGYDMNLDVRVAVKEYFPGGIVVRSLRSNGVTVVSDQAKAEGFRKGIEEFQNEAKRLAAIDSPNIVKVRDYFRENGTAYIVMGYLEGNSLTEEVKQSGGRMPWQRVTELFKPLILEMDKVHEEHLIHRDIKPDNIRVVREKDGRERLVLLDFGTARNFVSAEVTGTYSAMVTPGYAPMEQYSRKSRQGPYTDIYGLCASMYAAVSGNPPSDATDRVMGLAELKSFAERGIKVPEHIEKGILHGLAVRGEDRPQSMRDLYAELYGTPAPASEDLRAVIYEEGIWLMSADTFWGYKEAQRLLEHIPGWKDAGLLAQQCRQKAALLEEPVSAPDPVYRPEPAPVSGQKISVGDIIIFGSYSHSGSMDGVKEPIQWQVLAVDRDRALVISKYGLVEKKYNEKYESVTWETCTLRTWLNVVFYSSAFSNTEKERIRQVRLSNPDNLKYGTKGGKDTTDRIFLLSIDEAGMYFNGDEARKCLPMSFVKNDGEYDSGKNAGVVWWWLRSPGFTENRAAGVNSEGVIFAIGNTVSYDCGTVRPAFWMDL